MRNFEVKLFFIFFFAFTRISYNSQAGDTSAGLVESRPAARPFIIEVVGNQGEQLSLKQLIELCLRNHLTATNLYQWKNHLVVFARLQNPENLHKQISSKYPGCKVTVYNDLFYEFNRKKHCKDAHSTKEWDHVLLTANLVADKDLQKEYLEYHASQFEAWPEVSTGFCNADFQQLLLFKNDRQLMLVISIPKGASLEELNKRTTNNNPRVDHWNHLMKKYQVGIEGTQPDEVWVHLKKIGG